MANPAESDQSANYAEAGELFIITALLAFPILGGLAGAYFFEPDFREFVDNCVIYLQNQ